MNKKVVFLMTNMSIQSLWLSHLLKFYWFFNFNSQEFIFGSSSYKAHFRPQISSTVHSVFKRIILITLLGKDMSLSSNNALFEQKYKRFSFKITSP